MAWRDILGHDAVVAGLARAAERNRLAHAYLFAGPDGVGKKRVARQFAKTLSCEAPPPDQWDSCDECSACRLVEAGTHPDLVMVARPEDKVEMPLDSILEFNARLALKTARGSRKIGIVDDADDLNDESSNAFLKTLEEPPSQSILILIGESPDQQLPTIRSRCQIIRFSPLKPADVETLLRRDETLDPVEIPRLAQICGGIPGLAAEFAEPDLWLLRTRLLDALGDSTFDIAALARDVIAFVQSAGKDGGPQRRRASLLLRLVIDGLSEAMSASGGRDSTIARLARFDAHLLADWLDRCLAADEQIERRLQLVLVIEAWVDSLVAAPVS